MRMGSVAAIALAYGLFAATFRGERRLFWNRMTATGLTLGAIALAGGEGERVKPRLRDLPLGVAIAAGLFGIFQLGDRMARQVMPHGSDQIEEIYALREIRPKEEIALRLATVIGPAEELFWRGWLQRRIGWLASAGLYKGAHLVTGNVTLVGAAAVAGLYWSALRALGVPMGALIVSHSLWDIWIFLVQPTDTRG